MLLRDHGLDPDDPVSMLLFDGTRPWTDSEAILRILTRL
jgi:predicted DCC family thiol-disulfide oxidoreductase YuxK